MISPDSVGLAAAQPIDAIQHLWIELTNRCNLSCVHCYADSGPHRKDLSPLSFDEYTKILADARDLGCSSVQFIGGEPTLNPLLRQLFNFARAKGFSRIEIFSNLTYCNDGLLDEVKAAGVLLATSVYSAHASIHDRITRSPGSHAKTIATIVRALKKEIPIRVGIIEMDENVGSVTETEAFLAALGVVEIGSDRVRQIGRPAGVSEVNAGELCGHCWEGNLCVDPEGIVSPCIMSKKWRIGSLREGSISALLASNHLGEVRGVLKRDYEASTPVLIGAGSGPQNGKCKPGACSPQVGGPTNCFPKKVCASIVFGD